MCAEVSTFKITSQTSEKTPWTTDPKPRLFKKQLQSLLKFDHIIVIGFLVAICVLGLLNNSNNSVIRMAPLQEPGLQSRNSASGEVPVRLCQ